MTRTLLALFFACACACSASLPEPGTPEADRACASLRETIGFIDEYYPDTYGANWDQDVARAAFMLQVAEYAEQLKCQRMPLGEYAPLPDKMTVAR